MPFLRRGGFRRKACAALAALLAAPALHCAAADSGSAGGAPDARRPTDRGVVWRYSAELPAASFARRERSLALSGSAAGEAPERTAGAGAAPAPTVSVGARLLGVTAFASGGAPASAAPLSEDVIVARLLDADGKLLYETSALDPRGVRAEFFSTRVRATLGATHEIVAVHAPLYIEAPPLPGARTLEFYEPRWDGRSFSLERLDALQLPETEPEFATATPGAVVDAIGGRLETILSAGDPSGKVDILLIGDGYTSAQMPAWRKDARDLTSELFQENPFCMFENYFNVHRIDVVSRESGAGTGRVYSRRNALGSYLGCAGTDRLLCVDYARTRALVESLTRPDQREIIVVLVNDGRYGGSGGAIAAATVGGGGAAVVAHELGHSFAGLADEYDYGKDYCAAEVEPSRPNVTAERDPRKVKWRTTRDAGHFEGALYCKRGYFRPYQDSRMRNIYAPYQPLHLQLWYDRLKLAGDGSVNLNCPR